MATIMTRSGAKHWWGIDLPKGVLSLHKYHPEENWVEYTEKQRNAQYVATQNANIKYKRRSSRMVPCFVWVFYNPTVIYGGWWLYIKTLKEDYNLNFRGNNIKLIEKVMSLFPCGILPHFEFFEKWMVSFSKEYKHIGFKRKKQGLAQCWCVIDEAERLFDIIGRNN